LPVHNSSHREAVFPIPNILNTLNQTEKIHFRRNANRYKIAI
jgi:hypothetical protein